LKAELSSRESQRNIEGRHLGFGASIPEEGTLSAQSGDDRLTVLPPALSEQQLVEHIYDLAKKIGEGPDSTRLMSLGQALTGGGSAPMWRAVSPLEALDVDWLAEKLAGRSPDGSWITWILGLRNALIFAPVLVTWWALSAAAVAYRNALAGSPDLAQVPFLYLWERRFDGQAVLPLSEVAFVDVAILLILIVLTMAAGYLRDVTVRKHETQVQTCRHHVFVILSDAACVLADRLPYGTADTMQRLDQIGRALLSDMQQDRQRLRKNETRLTQQSSDLRDATVQLKGATDDLSDFARALMDITPRLERYLATIAETQSAVAQVQAQLQHDTSFFASTIASVTEQQGQKLSETLEALSTAAARAEQATLNLKEVFETVGERQKQLLEALERERTGQENLYQVFAGALVEFETALSEAAAYSRTMYGISVDVRELAATFPSVVNSLDTKLRTAAESQREAADLLGKVIHQLDFDSSDGRPGLQRDAGSLSEDRID
jgi:hypothetical protein